MDNSNSQQLLTRLAQHRERMASLGAHVVQESHYSKAEQNELTQAVEEYYSEVSKYWTPEDG
jgi:anti-sigma regulatory factor (Ser/Thr protein kinase)